MEDTVHDAAGWEFVRNHQLKTLSIPVIIKKEQMFDSASPGREKYDGELCTDRKAKDICVH